MAPALQRVPLLHLAFRRFPLPNPLRLLTSLPPPPVTGVSRDLPDAAIPTRQIAAGNAQFHDENAREARDFWDAWFGRSAYIGARMGG